MAVKAIPEGYHSVTPYLVVAGVPKLIDFMKQAFSGVELMRMDGPDGRVGHAEVRIGDSVIMMADAGGQYPARPTSLMLYVEDADATFKRAVAAGAAAVDEPTDKFYGDRSGTVQDASGNQWFISTHTEDVAPDEMARRAAKAAQQA